MRTSRLKLLQKPEVAALQLPDIVDAVTHHRQTRQAQSEGEAVPLFGVDAAHPQDFRVHQAARQQFYPPALLAHRATWAAADEALNIEFKARLDERKISGTQTHRHIAME